MGSGASTVVPANRLGQLLVEARLREGTDLEELAGRSNFTVGELSDFEAGHRVLNDRLVSTVTSLYEIDCGPIIPQRAELTIDLNDNVLSAAGHALPLESAAHDHVLERYLSLVYVLRNHQPGAAVPLRDQDVAILAASLAEREELIEEQLLLAMAEERESVKGLISWFRKRLWVPGAGALVGAVSIGTLVMVSSSSASTEPAVEPEPDPDPDGPANAAANLFLPAANPAATSSIAVPSTATPTTAGSSTTASTASPSTAVPSTAATSTAAPTTASPATTATPASAATPATATPRTPESVGAAAEALLPFNWQSSLPGWQIVYSGPNSGFRGLTYPYDNTIEMFVRDGDTAASLQEYWPMNSAMPSTSHTSAIASGTNGEKRAVSKAHNGGQMPTRAISKPARATLPRRSHTGPWVIRARRRSREPRPLRSLRFCAKWWPESYDQRHRAFSRLYASSRRHSRV